MKAVWKYGIPLKDVCTIRVAKGAKCLSVGCQGEDLYGWFLVDSNETATVERTFRVAGTGHLLNLQRYDGFVGTALMHNALLVWHVFEVSA